jgi:hypothetical protein
VFNWHTKVKSIWEPLFKKVVLNEWRNELCVNPQSICSAPLDTLATLSSGVALCWLAWCCALLVFLPSYQLLLSVSFVDVSCTWPPNIPQDLGLFSRYLLFFFWHIFIFLFLLFICAYNVWVISPPFPLPLSLPLYPLATRRKLFYPYL